MGAPFFRHWKDKAPYPVKPTEKTAGDPWQGHLLFGWLVMAGGVFTARRRLLLVQCRRNCVTATEKAETVVGRSGRGRGVAGDVAPEMLVPFLIH